jgi:hypothetical protein
VEVAETSARVGERSLLGWAATVRDGTGPLREPAGVLERAPEQHLHLGVEAAELLVGPAHQRIVHRGIDAQQDLPTVAHVYSEPALTTGAITFSVDLADR